MRVFRVLTYARANLEVVVSEQEGELLPPNDRHERWVRLDDGHFFKYGPDWKESKAEACLAAASELYEAGFAMVEHGERCFQAARAARGYL